MSARVFMFPPIKDGLDPRELYAPNDPPSVRRRIPDERPDIYETLRKGGYRWTWRDDVDCFVADIRQSPSSHALVAIFAIVAWTALLVAPFALGWINP